MDNKKNIEEKVKEKIPSNSETKETKNKEPINQRLRPFEKKSDNKPPLTKKEIISAILALLMVFSFFVGFYTANLVKDKREEALIEKINNPSKTADESIEVQSDVFNEEHVPSIIPSPKKDNHYTEVTGNLGTFYISGINNFEVRYLTADIIKYNEDSEYFYYETDLGNTLKITRDFCYMYVYDRDYVLTMTLYNPTITYESYMRNEDINKYWKNNAESTQLPSAGAKEWTPENAKPDENTITFNEDTVPEGWYFN